MELHHIIKLGYAIPICSLILMMWISYIESRETDQVTYPPCYFNSLCSCSKSVPDLGIVQCRDVTLPKVPDKINISKVFMLHLENNGLSTLEPYFLQSTGLYKIVIRRNPLTIIADEAFFGLERSLWELELSNDELSKVPNRALRYLQKLRLLDLSNNDINKIAPDNWKGLENSLEVLVLSGNAISHIPIDAFSGLPHLETLDLTGNSLRELDPAVFRDGMGRLAHLILADNQLSSIPYQALQPLRILKTLDLSFNRINKMSPESEPGTSINLNYQLNLNVFRIDYNQLTILEPVSFQYFNVLNKTYLDGNPLSTIEDNAFRQAKIKELYLRSCGLTTITPSAFEGLESYLELLDLSGNNISELPQDVFVRFEFLRTLSLSDNILARLSPVEAFVAFQFTLFKLDLRGGENIPIAMQELRRLRSLRELSVSRLTMPHLSPEDFAEFGVDLEELQVNFARVQSIKNNAFKFVHGLKKIDLSENSISSIETNAFVDVVHSLTTLRMSRAFSSSFSNLPAEALKVLNGLEELDLSNNRIKSMPDTAFHFLKKLRKLYLQDNIIDVLQKGTFQGDIHSKLEEILFSFNNLKLIQQHTFVDLQRLEQLHLDDNKIESLERRSFMNLQRLKRLNLRGNKIGTISYEAFQNLPELEHLDLAYNSLKKFDFAMFDQVGTLSVLHVNVSHNSISELNGAGAKFENERVMGGPHSNIKVLDFSYNNITVISPNYFKPVEISLTQLYLKHNSLFNATRQVFGNMPHLQILDISFNNLYEMDFDMFRYSKRLQVLNASNNRLADVPNDLFRFLQDLRIVDFSHNRLRALPDSMFREEGLERLDVSHNLLSKLPLNAFSVATAMSLCELDLSWNSISSLVHGGVLERFQHLNFLDLSNNRLAQIDAGTFRNLPRLTKLDLSHNSQLALEQNGLSFQGLEYNLLHLNLDNVFLSHVPLFPTSHLTTLSLANNVLPTLPPEMANNLTSLKKLDISNNDFSAVPIVTHSLTELRYLSLGANPISLLSNTSLLGVADHLLELDIRDLQIDIFENGAFCKMHSLKTLKMNFYQELKHFNVPAVLQYNSGLRELELHVSQDTEKDLEKEMLGELPFKLRTVRFSGKGLKKLSPHVLDGIRHPVLNFELHNTSIQKIPRSLFEHLGWARNISVHTSDNLELRNLLNPSTGPKPNLYKKSFLLDLKIAGNKWNCDCDLGWVEVWERKRRQYLCPESSLHTCRQTNDDLRIAMCSNKNNQSVIDSLKADIECGWSSSSRTHFSFGLIVSFLVVAGVF